MNITKLPNGDIELGDYETKMNKEWVNVVWVFTNHCFLGCPYCFNPPPKGRASSILDKFSIDEVVDAFKKFRDMNHKKVHITITGGEPLMVENFTNFCKKLTENDFRIDIQSNFLHESIPNFLNTVSPKNISEFMTCYHGWILDKNKNLQDKYFEHCRLANERGFTVITRTVVLPEEVDTLKEKKEFLQSKLPDGGIVMPVGYIKGIPRSVTDPAGAYPYAYSKEQKEIIDNLTDYRKQSQKAFHNGGGFFKGMECGAGCGFIKMDMEGNVSRCPTDSKNIIGNLMLQNINLNKEPEKCVYNFCYNAPWAMWFSKDPWNYIPGAKKEDSTYCRYVND